MKSFKYIAAALLSLAIVSCEDQIEAKRIGGESDNVTIKSDFGMNLVGRVTVDGQPRAGVVVSDGITVATTDNDGVYQMYTNNRQHVFISVPEDCEVPVNVDGSPAFYKELSFSSSSIIQRDFALKSCEKKTEWTLYAFADPQVGTETDVNELTNTVMPGILSYTSTLTNNAYGICLGDIVWNAPSLFESCKAQMQRANVPVFSVIGNHDHNETVKNDTESDKEYRDAMGPTYYSVNIGDCHIVTLDDILYSGVNGRNDYAQTITKAQLEWLEKDLSYVSRDKMLIICLHAPTKRRISSTHVSNNEDLYALVKDFKEVQILSGHTHNNFTTTIAQNITETTFGAVMGAFWYPICNDGSPRGFGVLTFNGNQLVDKYYQGSETPREYQMAVYAPSDAVLWKPSAKAGDAYDKILINVFCWHTDWIVEVQEDGGSWKTLDPATDRTGTPAWDPAVHAQVDETTGYLPANHNTAAPENNNDHMFLYKPASDSWKTVNVRATDPYGNVYTSSVNNK